jgi:2'-5' RNA ligase
VRLFVAVEVTAEALAAAQALSRRLRERTGKLAPAARVTWIPPSLMHLTIRFIGERPESELEPIIAALTPPMPLAPFPVVVAGAGAFPMHGAPRVLWAGVREGREGLGGLEREVGQRLQQVGIEPDARAFTPHLTLARVREAAGLRVGPLLDGLGDVPVATSLVEAITLFESRISETGPTYLAVRRFALRGA